MEPGGIAAVARATSEPRFTRIAWRSGASTNFSSSLHLEAQSLGALPFPPSLWHWDGLVLTPRGVYELRVNLGGDSKEVQAAGTVPDAAYSLNYSFYPDAPPNPYIEAAKQLPEVRTVLWFARFPVTRFHKEGAEASWKSPTYASPQMKPGRPSSFTYRVRFAQDGTVMSQGLGENEVAFLLTPNFAGGPSSAKLPRRLALCGVNDYLAVLADANAFRAHAWDVLQCKVHDATLARGHRIKTKRLLGGLHAFRRHLGKSCAALQSAARDTRRNRRESFRDVPAQAAEPETPDARAPSRRSAPRSSKISLSRPSTSAMTSASFVAPGAATLTVTFN